MAASSQQPRSIIESGREINMSCYTDGYRVFVIRRVTHFSRRFEDNIFYSNTILKLQFGFALQKSFFRGVYIKLISHDNFLLVDPYCWQSIPGGSTIQALDVIRLDSIQGQGTCTIMVQCQS